MPARPVMWPLNSWGLRKDSTSTPQLRFCFKKVVEKKNKGLGVFYFLEKKVLARVLWFFSHDLADLASFKSEMNFLRFFF